MSVGGGGERRILLVDQSGALDDSLGPALDAAGYGVSTVAAGSDCLQAIRADTVDAVVSEYDLPDFDGVQLLRSVRVSYPALPFVLVADEGSGAIAGDAIDAGVSGYVPDTDDTETILDRLADSLRRGDDDESHRRYRHIIEMSPAPINVFDEAGESLWCNDAVVELLDLDGPDELIGRSLFEFVHPDHHDLAREEMASVIDRKESTGPTRMKLETADGDVRHIHVSTAIGDFLGEDIGQAIAVDVTEREQRERQLQVLEQWLRHNIRNEVTLIRGVAEDIERGRVEDVSGAAATIRDHATRLATQATHERRVIELLSDPPDPVPVSLPDIARARVSECRAAHPDAEVELSVTGSPTIHAIPQIEAALGELVENAIRHNDVDDPAVTVTVTGDGQGRGVVRVADNGPGVPERELETLLLDHEVTQLDHGTGLGLLFVHWAVRLSDGDVRFETNEPRGSTVTLTLPTSNE